eukprot:gene4343-5071_t
MYRVTFKDSPPSDDSVDQGLLDREIRTSLFPAFHAVLKSPADALISPAAHVPQVQLDDPGAHGFLYLFKSGAKDYYGMDGIRWAKTKTNVRMIVYNEEQKAYKLKTHKKDHGVHVMRRQTHMGVDDAGVFWRKFEYKLIKREYLLKLEDEPSASSSEPNSDSKYSERLCVQDFPVLVHYLTRPAADVTGAPSIHSPPSSSPDVPSHPSLHHSPLISPFSNGANTDFLNSPPTAPIDDNFFLDFTDNWSTLATDPSTIPSDQASISSYSPDTSPSLEQSKIICLVNGFNCFAKNSKMSPMYYSFWAVFEGGIEILALPIAPEVLEFNSPIWGDAAITHFHIVCKQNGSKNIVQMTRDVPFCFTPSDHRGKLKIAFDRCKLYQPLCIIPKFRHSVKHLDLSHNTLVNVDFLAGFYRLESLILSFNQLTEHTVFPTLPELQNLDLSSNLINFPKVALFSERLIQSAPYLQSLNLADNEAYPCPFKAVSIEERKHANNVEGEIE